MFKITVSSNATHKWRGQMAHWLLPLVLVHHSWGLSHGEGSYTHMQTHINIKLATTIEKLFIRADSAKLAVGCT